MLCLCNEIEEFGKGIGNSSRYRIIEALLNGRKTVGELVKIVKLSQPAVSQHLKVLKSCRLVVDEKRGKEIFYDFNSEYALHLLKNLALDVKKQKSKKQNKK
ncbi:metalloregulator ArsR/SmtB family transcription factor [Patescibacteria group bacterium]|nr:metalloregulator ArsR/SmtB family transcription factor [Patescibacteria group bacterium]